MTPEPAMLAPTLSMVSPLFALVTLVLVTLIVASLAFFYCHDFTNGRSKR